MPESPTLLRGFLRVAAELIPVVRLEAMMNGPAGPEEGNVQPKAEQRIVMVKVRGQPMAWVAEEGMELVKFEADELTAVPEGQSLNDCAAGVLPTQPPAVLLDAQKLLLETERLRLEQLRQRYEERMALVSVNEAA